MEKPDLEKLLEVLNSGHAVPAGSICHEWMYHFSQEARKITALMNTGWHDAAELRQLMAELTGGEIDEDFMLFPPFYTDFGKNIHFGKKIFVNSCCCFQDQGGIWIGDNCLIGHQTVIATINHDLDPAKRGDNHARPVKIGRNVWVGAGVKILPGISIGDNAVIAAGAVVTRQVPENTVVGGVPAKFIRKVPEQG